MNRRGIGLFELLFTLCIFSLIIIMGIQEFKSFISRVHINNGLRSITSALNTARYKSIKMNKRVKFSIKNNKIVLQEKKDKNWETFLHFDLGEKVSACVRPEEVTLTLSEVSSSARNSFGGEISRVVSVGPVVRIEIECGFLLTALVTKRSTEELGLKKGEKVFASFKATAVHVIRRN